MSLRKTAAAAMLGAAALGVGATAIAQNVMSRDVISNARGIAPNYNIETLEAMMAELQIPVTRLDHTDGSQFLLATYNELKIILHPQVCDTNCVGMRMMMVFPDFPLDVKAANAFNQSLNPTRVVASGDDTIFYRYHIGDYGFVRGSFVIDFAVFSNTPALFASLIGAEGRRNEVSLQNFMDAPLAPANLTPGAPHATDNLADQLNRLSKVENGLQAVAAPAEQAQTVEWAPSLDHGHIDGAGYSAAAYNDALKGR